MPTEKTLNRQSMKQKLLLGILSVCALLNVGCDLIEDEYHHYYIGVENQSDSAIYVTLNLDWYYRDECYSYSRWHSEHSIEAGESSRFMADEGAVCGFGSNDYVWEECFERDDSLAVTIYDTIPPRYHYFHSDEEAEIPYVMRYLLTRDNLRELGWRIAYPPSAEMSNMTIIKPEEQ